MEIMSTVQFLVAFMSLLAIGCLAMAIPVVVIWLIVELVIVASRKINHR